MHNEIGIGGVAADRTILIRKGQAVWNLDLVLIYIMVK